MTKGYWIPHIDVNDPEGYKAYIAATPPAHHKFNGTGRWCAAAGWEAVEGRARGRNVLREFPDSPPRSPAIGPMNISARAHCGCNTPLRFRHRRGLRRPAAAATGFAAPPRRPARAIGSAAVDVTEPEGYKAYMAADMGAVSVSSAAVFWCAAAPREVVEGKVAQPHRGALEFPSFEAALGRYRSPDYQAGKKTPRQSKAAFDLVIVEGHDGPRT